MTGTPVKKRVPFILKKLDELYPDATVALHYGNTLELLVAVILSAQCTDVRVNMVTPALFRRYRTAEDYAAADMDELEELIRTTGFFHNKAKSIKSCCGEIAKKHKGRVPRTMDELTALPGVGRKTANVILGNAFGVPGIIVDTHVIRLTGLIGLTKNTDPVKIEFDMMEIIPKEKWTQFSNQLIYHGRQICIARRPKCSECAIRTWCDYGLKAAR